MLQGPRRDLVNERHREASVDARRVLELVCDFEGQVEADGGEVVVELGDVAGAEDGMHT
jgi:hypothetical protein